MIEKTTPYDPADSLQSKEAIRIFLNDALLTEDVTYIFDALQVAIKAHASLSIRRDDIPQEGLPLADPEQLTLKELLVITSKLGLKLICSGKK